MQKPERRHAEARTHSCRSLSAVMQKPERRHAEARTHSCGSPSAVMRKPERRHAEDQAPSCRSPSAFMRKPERRHAEKKASFTTSFQLQDNLNSPGIAAHTTTSLLRIENERACPPCSVLRSPFLLFSILHSPFSILPPFCLAPAGLLTTALILAVCCARASLTYGYA